MTNEEIIELAKKCGFVLENFCNERTEMHEHGLKMLLAFATEIRNRTIQECVDIASVRLAGSDDWLVFELLKLKGDEK